MTTPLLAKSASSGQAARTLTEHTDDVLEAFDALFGGPEPRSLAGAWLRFFKLDADDRTRAVFLRHGRVAALCHDWGKANNGFQQMLVHRGKQVIRHEHLSAVLVAHGPIWRWLNESSLDAPLILAAVAGHHLKARDVTFGRAEAEGLVELHWDNAAFRHHLAARAATLGLSANVSLDVPRVWTFDGTLGAADLEAALDVARDYLHDLHRALRDDDPRHRMLRAVRAALIVADCAGSGLPREGKTIALWVREGFFERRSDHDTPDGRMTVDTIGRAIIAPRMEKMGITPEQLNAFQIACGDPDRVPERALLLAPCGSGKTLAAWRWVAARCAERPRRRAIFLYPTRGTATEGYRDYVALAGPEEAALDHGTADLDLDGIHADVPDEDRINQARLFALRQWPKRLFSATVDQFLGFLQHGYGPTCHLPLLADSVVVCDEVHSYDRGMFSALIEFLRHFDVPVLCMTATMLQDRRDRLLKGGPELGSGGLAYVNGLGFDADAGNGESDLRRAAEHPRYAARRAADEAAAEDAVRAALADRKRVLWVVNNVDRCQSLASKFAADIEADTLTTADGYPLFCYHSRFRLKDRKRWHEAVVHAFKPKDRGGPGGPVLAVTTQVCEMSLDLDADVLVTEVCPGTALVQRMGRCCRDAKAHQSGRTGAVIIYEPPGEDARLRRLPYAIQDLAGVDELIDVLTVESMVSQGRLEHLLLQLPAPAELPKACRFIDSVAWAAAGEEQFRDGDDFTCPAVLINPVPGERGADADAYARIWNPKTRRKADRPWDADALVINVPKSKGGTPHVQAHNGYDLPKWLHWAINGTYSKTLGFRCGLTHAAWIV